MLDGTVLDGRVVGRSNAAGFDVGGAVPADEQLHIQDADTNDRP